MYELKSYQKSLVEYLKEDSLFQQVPKDLVLRHGTFGALYGTRLFITDEAHPQAIAVSDHVPSPKDFAKAKTGKERLEARLTRKKGKPSSLLSKLVSKT